MEEKNKLSYLKNTTVNIPRKKAGSDAAEFADLDKLFEDPGFIDNILSIESDISKETNSSLKNSASYLSAPRMYGNHLNSGITSRSSANPSTREPLINKHVSLLKEDPPMVPNNNTKNNKPKNICFQIISREKILIETDFYLEPELMDIIKSNNGYFDRESRFWHVPYLNYMKVMSKFKESPLLAKATITPLTNLPIEVLMKIDNPKLKFKIDGKMSEISYSKDQQHKIAELHDSFLSKLYPFQKIGIEFAIRKNGRLLIADEMGVGKTIQAIGVAAIFKEDWPVLVIAPSSLKYNWRDEITNWLKEEGVLKTDVQVIKGSKDELKSTAKFFIISYDLCWRIPDKLQEKNFRFAIADEAHYIKSIDAKRTQILVPMFQKCKRLLLLTGTPILARPVELFPVLKSLRPDIFTNFKAFGTRYCDPQDKGYGIEWKGATNMKELNFILNNLMIRRLKKDVLSQLPPKKRQNVEIECDKKIIKQIKAILGKLRDDEIDFETNEEKLNKFDEDSGSGTEEAKKEESALASFSKAYSLTALAKVEGIKEYISYLLENNCKFLIFAHHTGMLNAIEEYVKSKKFIYIRIDGSVNNEKRHNLVQHFQNNENCRIAILAITACATGLTLTKASTVLFAELYFTPATMQQAEDRAHRIGQEHKCVNIHYLFGRDTVDEIILRKMDEKHKIVTTTVDDKGMRLEIKKTTGIGDFEEINATKNTKENTKNKYMLDNSNSSPIKLNLKGSKALTKNSKNTTLDSFFVVRDSKLEKSATDNCKDNNTTSNSNFEEKRQPFANVENKENERNLEDTKTSKEIDYEGINLGCDKVFKRKREEPKDSEEDDV